MGSSEGGRREILEASVKSGETDAANLKGFLGLWRKVELEFQLIWFGTC